MVARVLFLTLFAITTTRACDFMKRDLKCGNEWGYLSTNGPHTWSNINGACSYGTSVGHQTPIHVGPEVPREKSGHGRSLVLPRGGYEVLNNGHSVVASASASAEEGPGMEVAGEVWTFEQFHFHTPAEHTLPTGGAGPGMRHPMEVHFVHKSASNGSDLAVVGMFFELVDASTTTTTAGNRFVETLLNALPSVPSCGDITAIESLGQILEDEITPLFTDAGVDVATYAGSLTTPPCSEGVRWFVVTNRRIPISSSQARRFRAVLGDNARCTGNVYAEEGWRNVAAACEGVSRQ